MATSQTLRSVKVWDLPVRVCHWGFALLIPAMWWTAENSMWAWHKRCGLLLLGLLVFRIIWGFVGSRTARFATFVKGPRSVFAYLRGDAVSDERDIGHSPLGALSVIAMLLAMLIQVGMGFFVGDPFDGATGPLNPLVGVLTADMLTDWHETFFWVVVGLVGLHLAAVAFYTIAKRHNLIGPMINGSRSLAGGPSGIVVTSWTNALIAMLVSVGFVAWIVNGAPPLG